MEHFDIDHVSEELDEIQEKLITIMQLVRESGDDGVMEVLQIALENIIAARNGLNDAF